ncbi:GNAT family N-acetyltransferase [Fervidibacillus halotolerans]|uniref:GNAT family N-acetyltransferase n=1 Tax=Fervidibacillus halotolerans TaxID=2980027 RepID=A0A9E8M0E4_9BACI|nr:GNAT family N-acetyltransferase [Fervidibacillus halotolerans]WAA13090.1 GNAT family N-acetyltransferase [Fervidibacillus halotolerans]
MEVIIAQQEKQLKDALKVRHIVFVEEQKVPLEEEIDQYEDESTHFVLYNNQKEPIGAGRFREVDGVGKIERICVLPSYRKRGLGELLMEKIIEFAKENHFSKVKLNSQTHAIPFYEKLGFTVVSDEFMDAGIPHKTMERSLSK